MRLLILATVMFGLIFHATAAPTIKLTRVEVSPSQMARGESFTLTLAAEGDGVDVKSYRVRTPYKVPVEEVPPGFYHEGGMAVFEAEKGAILDNGKYDLDPANGVVSVKISTDCLPVGTNYLVAFAHNRPGDGAHVLDFSNLRLDVTAESVKVTVVGKDPTLAKPPVEFTLPENPVAPGEAFTCGAQLTEGAAGDLAIRLHGPYAWGEDEVLPGFTYYADQKIAYIEDGPDHLITDNGRLDADPAQGSIRVSVSTDGWPSGAHFLTLDTPLMDSYRAPYGKTADIYRDFFVHLPDPADKLVVQVEPSQFLCKGTHFGTLVSMGDGRVLAEGLFSEDYGQTWRGVSPSMPRPNLLSDGTLMAMEYRAYPVDGQKGVYTGKLWLSEDGGVTVEGPIDSKVIVPLARAALGHGQHVGPLFGRSIVELDNGELISAMYGWFDGDTQPDHYRNGGTMRRSYICKSSDRGLTWEYLSTVAYRPFLGNEGYSELVIRKLPDGDVYALVRTGGNSSPGWQDNPLMMSRSSDGGKTWTEVQRTGVEGVWPDLCVMSDGTLVCSTGRPGAFVMFSTDDGKSWHDITPIDAERYSGYTAICEVRPGELLMGYGARNGLDPDTGERSDQLRTVRIKLRRR